MELRFKVDEDLPLEVAEVLRDHGYNATTVLQQNLSGATDEKIWEIIQAEQHCIITANKGVADARKRPPGSHRGIILFRLQQESRAGYIRLAQELVDSESIQKSMGAIIVVSPESIRIHRSRPAQ